MKIIVGLGNPGEEYKYTHHNAGFLAIDELVKSLGLNWDESKKFNAQICKTKDAIYVKPLTFMNESGRAVQAVMSYYKLLLPKKNSPAAESADLSELLTVIHDDLDIALGKSKLSADSRSAGHKGVQSIIDFLGTKNFQRLRIGIGQPVNRLMPAEKFVLEKFKKEELETINVVIKKAIEEI